MKKLLLLNLIPHIIIDVIAWILFLFGKDSDVAFKTGIYILLSQYVIVLPFYYVATLAVFHFKYKLNVLKGFILQLTVLFISKSVFVVIASVFWHFLMGQSLWSYSEAMELMLGIDSAITYLLPPLVIMLPGTVVIAVVSYMLKRKGEKS